MTLHHLIQIGPGISADYCTADISAANLMTSHALSNSMPDEQASSLLGVATFDGR
jgi:hypothetical protein